MKRANYKHTIIVFGLAVVLPSLIVCFAAGFAINQEYKKRVKELEYNRESFKGMLYGNMSMVVDLINQKVRFVEKQLSGSISFSGDTEEMKRDLLAWKESMAYVDIPFLLSPDFEIQFPVSGSPGTVEAAGFSSEFTKFLSNKSTIPVYENVILSAKDGILKEPREMPKDMMFPPNSVTGERYIDPQGRIQNEEYPGMVVERMMAPIEEQGRRAEKVGYVNPVLTIPMSSIDEKMVDMMGLDDRISGPLDSGYPVGVQHINSSSPSMADPMMSGFRAVDTNAAAEVWTNNLKTQFQEIGMITNSKEKIIQLSAVVGDLIFGLMNGANITVESAADAFTQVAGFINSDEFKGIAESNDQETRNMVSMFLNVAWDMLNNAERKYGDELDQKTVNGMRNVLKKYSDKMQNMSGIPYSDNQSPGMMQVKENTDETALFDAAAYFSESQKIRLIAYKHARDRGKQITLRKGSLLKNEKDLGDFTKMSLFVSEPLRLSGIVEKRKQGIIPVVIDGRLRHVFWKKNDAGFIAGGLIKNGVFPDTIYSVLSQPEILRIFSSSFMIVTVTEEKDVPVIRTPARKSINWKYPFASLEISAVFPYWELSTYLVDQGLFVSKARTKAINIWVVVLAVFILITAGGVIVLRSVYLEMKLASQKTSFVANVSHELKTPLTSIRMLTEMLRTKRQIDETKKEQYLDMVISESERLTRLINDVLDFSSMERGKKTFDFKKINIVSLCKAVFEVQKVRLEHNGFHFRLMSEYEQLMVEVDEESMARTIINLLSNAEKYSAGTKEISLDISKHHGFALITVLDRGIGIPPEKAKDLFKEFYRVDNSLTSKVKGTGLGLAIAQRIVHEHKGEIQYLPRDGGGSIFQVKLPLVNS